MRPVDLHPEPVPPASQLAILPFLAAVDGYLREFGNVPGLRLTVHRSMTRAGKDYLQQACAYLNEGGGDWRGKVGRTFAVDTGIMGATYKSGKIWRTKHYADEASLLADLPEDERGEGGARSWLTIPFLGPERQIVIILFAECASFNFFSDDERVRRVVAMGDGFTRLFDWLQRDPFENLRNFPLKHGEPVGGEGGVFEVQEELDIKPPSFAAVPSFNYEAAVA